MVVLTWERIDPLKFELQLREKGKERLISEEIYVLRFVPTRFLSWLNMLTC